MHTPPQTERGARQLHFHFQNSPAKTVGSESMKAEATRPRLHRAIISQTALSWGPGGIGELRTTRPPNTRQLLCAGVVNGDTCARRAYAKRLVTSLNSLFQNTAQVASQRCISQRCQRSLTRDDSPRGHHRCLSQRCLSQKSVTIDGLSP